MKHLLYTHCHIDHVLGHAYVCETYNVAPRYHKIEDQVMDYAAVSAQMYGVEYKEGPRATEFLVPGEKIFIGEHEFTCLFCPGHSPGSIVFYDGKQLAIGGDVLFQDSIGRTDLPGGDHEQLLKSISEQLYVLPDDVAVYPGHGPRTTIGHEKKNNPFVKSE